jgi:hypothetical protein
MAEGPSATRGTRAGCRRFCLAFRPMWTSGRAGGWRSRPDTCSAERRLRWTDVMIEPHAFFSLEFYRPPFPYRGGVDSGPSDGAPPAGTAARDFCAEDTDRLTRQVRPLTLHSGPHAGRGTKMSYAAPVAAASLASTSWWVYCWPRRADTSTPTWPSSTTSRPLCWWTARTRRRPTIRQTVPQSEPVTTLNAPVQSCAWFDNHGEDPVGGQRYAVAGGADGPPARGRSHILNRGFTGHAAW